MPEERKRKMSIDEIFAIALELPGEQLDELIDRLAAHREMHPDLEQEWRAEVRRRLERIGAGDVEWIDGDEVLAELRADP